MFPGLKPRAESLCVSNLGYTFVSSLGDTLCQNLGYTWVLLALKSGSQLGNTFGSRAARSFSDFDRRAKFEKFRFVQGAQQQIG
jgi:hypothetical protein